MNNWVDDLKGIIRRPAVVDEFLGDPKARMRAGEAFHAAGPETTQSIFDTLHAWAEWFAHRSCESGTDLEVVPHVFKALQSLEENIKDCIRVYQQATFQTGLERDGGTEPDEMTIHHPDLAPNRRN